MSLFKRLFSSRYRSAVSAEAAGDFLTAARCYALSGEQDKVVDMHLAQARLETTPDDRIRELRIAQGFVAAGDSRRDMILLRIGILYGEGGDHARAIEYYRQAVEENPFNADAEFNLAVGLGELGQYQEAIAHYQRALELDPAMEAARHNLEILNAR